MDKKFFRVCESNFGERTCIYHYINPNQIVSFKISYGTHEVCIEAVLTNNMRVILMSKDDVISLIGNDEYLKIKEDMTEYAKEHFSRR